MKTNVPTTHAEIDTTVAAVIGDIFSAKAYFVGIPQAVPAVCGNPILESRCACAASASLESLSQSDIPEGATVELAAYVPGPAYCLTVDDAGTVCADMVMTPKHLVIALFELRFSHDGEAPAIGARFLPQEEDCAENKPKLFAPHRRCVESGGFPSLARILAQSTGIEIQRYAGCNSAQAALIAEPMRLLAATLRAGIAEPDDPDAIAVIHRGAAAAAKATRILIDTDLPAYLAGCFSERPIRAAASYLPAIASLTEAGQNAGWSFFSVELYGRYMGHEWFQYSSKIDSAGEVSLYFPDSGRYKEIPDYERYWDRRLTKDIAPLKKAGVDEETMKGVYSVLLFAIMLADQSPRTLAKLEEAASILCDYARIYCRTARVLQSLGPLEWLT